MKQLIVALFLAASLSAIGQDLPPAPYMEAPDLHLPDPGEKMRGSAILPAVVLGGFAMVASQAEPNPMASQVLASLAIMGSTTIYLAGDHKKRKARRLHQ
jgi:hypothetical protein